MDQPALVRHFPTIFNFCTSFNVKAGKIRHYTLWLRIVSNIFLVCSTSWCLSEGEPGQDSFKKSHDVLILIFFISTQFWLLTNDRGITELIHFLVEPLSQYDMDTPQHQLVEEYSRKVHKLCNAIIRCIAVLGPLWTFSPMWFLLDFKDGENRKFLHLPVGWIPSPSNSRLVIILTYLAALSSSVMNLVFFYCWILTILFSVLKIKHKIKLLRADLVMLETHAENLVMAAGELKKPNETPFLSETILAGSGRWYTRVRRKTLHSPRDLLSINTAPVDQPREEGTEFDSCLIKCLDVAIEEHVKIIKYIRLVNDNTRVSVLFYNQLSIIVAALAVPNISIVNKLTALQLVHRAIEVFGTLVITGATCYLGQIILNQSEKLRFALYDFRWLDKSPMFKRHFHTMQIVSTRNLRITAGGIYTLGMESYTTILSAAYSYASLLQSLGSEDK